MERFELGAVDDSALASLMARWTSGASAASAAAGGPAAHADRHLAGGKPWSWRLARRHWATRTQQRQGSLVACRPQAAERKALRPRAAAMTAAPGGDCCPRRDRMAWISSSRRHSGRASESAHQAHVHLAMRLTGTPQPRAANTDTQRAVLEFAADARPVPGSKQRIRVARSPEWPGQQQRQPIRRLRELLMTSACALCAAPVPLDRRSTSRSLVRRKFGLRGPAVAASTDQGACSAFGPAVARIRLRGHQAQRCWHSTVEATLRGQFGKYHPTSRPPSG